MGALLRHHGNQREPFVPVAILKFVAVGHGHRDFDDGRRILGFRRRFNVDIESDNSLQASLMVIETVGQRTIEQHSNVIELVGQVNFIG